MLWQNIWGKENEWEAKVSANAKFPEPVHMSVEDKLKFLAQAKINVPIEEKSQWEDLLCKLHDVFSKDKTDLGKANNFEHKMNLKEANPEVQRDI
jgi:hypothetical protein